MVFLFLSLFDSGTLKMTMGDWADPMRINLKSKEMKYGTLILFFVCQLAFGNPPYWSKTGHRVIGHIAEQHLTGKSKKAISKLLNGASLASVSNFGDEIKADSLYKKFGPWHFVNFPADKNYTDVEPSPQGDLIIGIEECIRIIKDKHAPDSEKAFYLKMLVHFIGDLHQPMHVGRLEDRGGNDIHLQWFNRGSNLHKVWDDNMIDDHGMSYTELSESLPKWSKAQIKAVGQGTIYDWVEDSQEIANAIYDSVEPGEKLYYRYGYVWWSTVESQLQKGGIRLAKVLNELF